MKLTLSKSKNSTSLYVTKSVYKNGKSTSKVVEKLGTYDDLKKKLNGEDPIAWAKKYIADLNQKEKTEKQELLLRYHPEKIIPKEKQRFFNGGYLFLQTIYHELGLSDICKELSEKHKLSFSLDDILSRLLYGRMIFPTSNRAAYRLAIRFLESVRFSRQDTYRALEILSKESTFIQTRLYQNITRLTERKTDMLYYDCTNHFFEREQTVPTESFLDLIVQMDLLMDAEGIPITFTVHQDNQKEPLSRTPLEEKIASDFQKSTFVICTGAEFDSPANRKFNDTEKRAFITAQPFDGLRDYIKEWLLEPTGWQIPGCSEFYDISRLDYEHKEIIFYKERGINENGIEQRIIATYSINYRNYQRHIRETKINSESKKPVKNTALYNSPRSRLNHDPMRKRFPAAEATLDEQEFDGFYVVSTNVKGAVDGIIKTNNRRWEIREYFQIMKNEFKESPSEFLRSDRMEAYFLMCFLSLFIFRFLEKKLLGKYSYPEIVRGLRNMNFFEISGDGYIPTYTRTGFTDDLHEAFGFRTDYQIIKSSQMKLLFKRTKKVN